MATRASEQVIDAAARSTEPATLAEALKHTWTRWPEQVALVFGDQRMTYAALGEAVCALAAAYRRLGIRRGDRVVCSVSNGPEYIIALGAAWQCGAVHVGMDYQSTAPELAAVLDITEARALIYEPADDAAEPFLPVETLAEAYPGVRFFGVGAHAVPPGCLDLAALIETTTPDDEPPEGPAPDDPAMIFISSGTTGQPKAALGYHGNLCHRWQRLGGWLKFGPDDVHLAQLPLSHGFGMMMAVAALLQGGRLVLLRAFKALEALERISREGVTVFNGAPAHFNLLLSRLDPTRHDVRSLRLSVGTAAAFSPSLVRALWDDLGVTFMFMYGSSEGVGVATTDREDILLGSVGRPAPGSVAIVDPGRTPLPVGETGEIAFSRKVFPVRYWSDTAPRNQQAWYYSGDLGRLDEAGRLYVFGRLKHRIDRGGLKVDPVEVEAALLECAGVADAAVLGLPNPVLGETVCACVVPTPGERPGLETLRAALSDRLAPFKLPEELCLLDAIPRTQLGKVDLARLRAEVEVAERQHRRR